MVLASSMVQTVRFAWFILQLDGAEQCIASRRILGQAEIQLAGKKATRQARPLTVHEVLLIHKMAADPDQNLVTRLMCVHLLLMLYCRCRNSGVAHVQSIMHDSVGDNKQSSCDGFIQLSTRHHKSSRSAESKPLLLPIVGSGVSVGTYNWIEQWVSVRKQAGLPVSGSLDGPVQPAPRGAAWYKRSFDSTETARILRLILQCDDDDLLSHSLKTTALSWAAKGNVAKEHRRIPGRHMPSIKDSDSIHSRDLLVAPVRALSAVIRLIQYPDNPRSNLPNPVFQPKTPVFSGSKAAEKPKAYEPVFQDSDEFVERSRTRMFRATIWLIWCRSLQVTQIPRASILTLRIVMWMSRSQATLTV